MPKEHPDRRGKTMSSILFGSDFSSLMHRRSFLLTAGAAGAASGIGLGAAYTQNANAADYTLRIAPLRLELAPDKVIDTFGYNRMVPGPLLRLLEGRQVSIDIRNDTDIPDIIHWHGLLPSAVDGAMEEGSPMVEPSHTERYTFTPKPSGTRWYHSHDVASTDLTRSLYSGMYGFLVVKPTNDPGRYDREILLAAHHWEPRWVSMQDIRKGPPPDNGLEVLYGSASFNDSAPTATPWDYTIFGDDRAVPEPDRSIELAFEKIPGGRGGYNRWTLNGKSWPNTNPLFTTEVGKRYRLVMSNKSGDNHPVHLPSAYVRNYQGGRQDDGGRDERYRQHDTVQHRRD
jgi:FtsP/CotA-like multicopper oxidase with cupredoxin domain